MIQLNGYATDAETPLDALTTYITPNDLFFVRHHWNPAYQNERRWALAVDGEVERPLRLTMTDLKRMPRASATCVLTSRPFPECSGSTERSATPGGREFASKISSTARA
jgi:sulfane dehydrogenase subunit SoxC